MTPRNEALIVRALTMIARRSATVGGRETLPVAIEAMGARIQFKCGTHEVRLAGVVASCTAGRVQAVTAWQRNARRELDRARAGEDA